MKESLVSANHLYNFHHILYLMIDVLVARALFVCDDSLQTRRKFFLLQRLQYTSYTAVNARRKTAAIPVNALMQWLHSAPLRHKSLRRYSFVSIK